MLQTPLQMVRKYNRTKYNAYNKFKKAGGSTFRARNIGQFRAGNAGVDTTGVNLKFQYQSENLTLNNIESSVH